MCAWLACSRSRLDTISVTSITQCLTKISIRFDCFLRKIQHPAASVAVVTHIFQSCKAATPRDSNLWPFQKSLLPHHPNPPKARSDRFLGENFLCSGNQSHLAARRHHHRRLRRSRRKTRPPSKEKKKRKKNIGGKFPSPPSRWQKWVAFVPAHYAAARCLAAIVSPPKWWLL